MWIPVYDRARDLLDLAVTLNAPERRALRKAERAERLAGRAALRRLKADGESKVARRHRLNERAKRDDARAAALREAARILLQGS